MIDVKKHSAFLLSLPFALVIATFFIVPLCLVIMVSFWDYTSYSIIPDFILTNYEDIFYGCIRDLRISAHHLRPIYLASNLFSSLGS